MDEYKNAAKGLKKMYKATINMLIGLAAFIVLSWIPVLPYLILIIIIAYAVDTWIGMYSVGKDIPLCKIAFILQVVSVAISVLSIFISQLSTVGTVAGMLPIIAQLMMIGSVTKTLEEKGAAEAVKWGKLAFWFYVAMEAGGVLSTILPLVFTWLGVSLSITLLLLIVTLGAAICSLVFMLIFLKNAARAFGAYF